MTTVVINGRDYQIEGKELTYDKIVEAIHGNLNINTLYLISYAYRWKGRGGTLAPRSPGIEIEQGMIVTCHILDTS